MRTTTGTLRTRSPGRRRRDAHDATRPCCQENCGIRRHDFGNTGVRRCQDQIPRLRRSSGIRRNSRRNPNVRNNEHWRGGRLPSRYDSPGRSTIRRPCESIRPWSMIGRGSQPRQATPFGCPGIRRSVALLRCRQAGRRRRREAIGRSARPPSTFPAAESRRGIHFALDEWRIHRRDSGIIQA